MTLTLAIRMISSEILKLRKKRSTMLWALFLGAGSMVIYYAYAALDHASDPAHHGPAGGALGFARGLQGLAILIGPLAAAMIGTESGAGDTAAAVFRDLVATGRSRFALFLVRIPAALPLTLGCLTLGLALAAVASFVLRMAAPLLTSGSSPPERPGYFWPTRSCASWPSGSDRSPARSRSRSPHSSDGSSS